MRPLRALAVYIVVVFIGGALLGPWLYWCAQSIGGEFPHIAHSPFHRFVHRSILGLALLGIWPVLKESGITSLKEAGLVRPAGNWGKLGLGLLLGFASLALIAGLALASGARQIQSSFSAWHLAQKAVSIGLAAIAVAVLEEILFRGAIFGCLRKVFHWQFALALSSLIYALVHFLERSEITGSIHWFSGLQLLPHMLRGFTDLHALIPAFFNLTLAGLVLGLAYQRTGNLYFSIGLHAGWIFWLKSFGQLTQFVSGTSDWWWGTGLINGWLALPILAGMVLMFWHVPPVRRPGFQT